MKSKQPTEGPIFIHGIDQRSGTNFLWQLLLLHKKCHPGSVGEDFILQNAHHLQEFSKNLYRQWIPSWQQRMGGTSDRILELMGSSLVSLIRRPYYLYDNVDPAEVEDYIKNKKIEESRLVSKTPNVTNIDLFEKMFPNAQLVIIVRDGRSVAESGVKSFNWNFEQAAHRWADAANKILDFKKTHQSSSGLFTIVKFEDLFLNSDLEIKKVLSFLNLDIEQYDLDAAINLPIFGSSELKKDKVHWKAVDKPKEFDPTLRWKDWDKKKHRQFNKIAGDAMEKFGYELKFAETNLLSRVLGKRPVPKK